MNKLRRCQRCGQDFEGWHNGLFCPECKPLRRRERGRIWEARKKGSPVAEGKWRCPLCGAFKDKEATMCRVCFNQRRSGDGIWNWKGGRIEERGYVLIRQGVGKNAKYVQEHRLVWEAIHGQIPKGYIIHHLNGIKDDNRLENLACLLIGAHLGPAVNKVSEKRIRQLEARIRELEKVIQGDMLAKQSLQEG